MKASFVRSTIIYVLAAARAVRGLKPSAAVHTSSSPRSTNTTQPARALFSTSTPGMALAVISGQPAGSRHAPTGSRSCTRAYARKPAPSPAPVPQYLSHSRRLRRTCAPRTGDRTSGFSTARGQPVLLLLLFARAPGALAATLPCPSPPSMAGARAAGPRRPDRSPRNRSNRGHQAAHQARPLETSSVS